MPLTARTVTAPRPRRGEALCRPGGRRLAHGPPRPSEAEGEGHEPTRPHARGQEVQRIERNGDGAAFRGGGVAGHRPEPEARGRQGQGLEAEQHPVRLAILAREPEKRGEEHEHPRASEPDRSVARVQQDRQEATPRETLAGARASGHADLAPEVDHPGDEGHGDRGAGELQKSRVQLGEPVATRLARRAGRRARHQDQRGEDANERDRAGGVEPAHGYGGELHQRDQRTRRPGSGPVLAPAPLIESGASAERPRRMRIRRETPHGRGRGRPRLPGRRPPRPRRSRATSSSRPRSWEAAPARRDRPRPGPGRA